MFNFLQDCLCHQEQKSLKFWLAFWLLANELLGHYRTESIIVSYKEMRQACWVGWMAPGPFWSSLKFLSIHQDYYLFLKI